MILVDTNVWIHHLQKADSELRELLEKDLVVVHPWVVGELALGSLKNRDEILELLNNLESAPVVDAKALMEFIRAHELWNRGIGWVDVQILAACERHPCRLLTRDQRLREAATELGLAAVGA